MLPSFNVLLSLLSPLRVSYYTEASTALSTPTSIAIHLFAEQQVNSNAPENSDSYRHVESLIKDDRPLFTISATVRYVVADCTAQNDI
jgi:hypothetical protein